ncbi:hypothetical protein [uncultured Limosilactobacillus sp.]|uniref:hypothetical protein n=1 Tax=uncultured Limosilactobacillus sp. TaxID=2837629 RepID=UPI0025F752F5|nr:hypothetical protein [uncultured Limosilactobacillus sp.]
MYDYRNELMELLKHTSDDPASLKQTQRSLTMILRLLNRLQPVDDWAVGDGDEDWNHRHHHHRDDDRQQGSHRFRMRRRREDEHHQAGTEGGHHEDHQGQHHRRTHELVDHPGEKMPKQVSGEFASLLDKSLNNVANQGESTPLTQVSDDESAKGEQPETEKQPATAKPTSATTSDQPAEPTEAELAADNRYVVHRKLSGAMINRQYYSERVLHALPYELEDGDVVELGERHGAGLAPIIKKLKVQHDGRPIQVLRRAPLREVAGTKMFQISETQNGDSPLDAEEGATLLIDPKRYGKLGLHAGMPIDFAYYDHGHGMRDAASGTLRWAYEGETVNDHHADQPQQTSTPQSAAQPAATKPVDPHFDLHQRKVLVISAKPKQWGPLREVMADHHGVFYGLDASRPQNVTSSKLKQALRQVDTAIVCEDGVDGKAVKLAARHAEKYGVAFEKAPSSDQHHVEHALGRLQLA